MDYKNKKIVIFGLGSYEGGSGISAALFLAKHKAKLLVTDLKTKSKLTPQLKKLKKYKNIKYVLGQHRKQDFQNADLVIKNPGVPKDSPYLKMARQNKIPIINDWTIFFDKYPDNLIIGITGTKGKSTTTALIYEMLKSSGKDAVLCGNIGQSPLAILNKIKKDTIVVAELSSWLLQEFKKSPQISIITNLMPEHLDKYKNLKEYYKDKKNIFKFQNKNDYLILNKNDANLKKLTGIKSRIIWYDGKPKNAAIAVAKILKIPKNKISKSLKNFKGLWGRLQLSKEKNGIKYYNDTCATMPDATIYALKSLKTYKKKIVLIAGGVNKNLNYDKLRKEIPKYVKTLILFEGGAFPEGKIRTMKEAVKLAEESAKKGDIILLSPAAASFNLFKNEFDRGEQFIKAIQ